MNVDHFEIQRSQNGQQFVTAGAVNAKGNGNSSKADYSWIDSSPLSGTSYYRIKEVDIDGGSKFSLIVRADLGKINSKLNLFPNPAIDKRYWSRRRWKRVDTTSWYLIWTVGKSMIKP
jgi:hypothetical protein